MKKLLVASFLFITLNSFGGDDMNSVRYSAYFKTLSSSCILSVNGLDYLSTLRGSRTINTGMDITDSLENSVNNTVGLIFFPSESKIKTDIYTCEVKIIRSAPKEPDVVVTNFKVSFNGENSRPFNDPEGYKISDLSDTTHNPIIKGISNRIIFAGDTKPEDWLTATRNITVSGIPVWQWTKAPSQINDLTLRGRLIDAYKDLINDLRIGDLATIKKKYATALDEYALADLTDDTDLFFDSIGIVNAVEKGKINPNPNWDEYTLLTYQNGRIFCLGIDSVNRNSPLEFFNTNGKRIFSWNPFFAIIDNKVVLVR
ncbi:hypothetical protein [Atlantibacter subterraneus]|uniref:hypothetical protein n=1 Tax=Atlantibacter subterraneus TaxID=255519 RepID=UPI00118283C6|nr:hypothetical protein [Atlantibacter subterranea]TSJ59195.1 hypothetical protein FND52_01805 [Atlantibacter subterranea]